MCGLAAAAGAMALGGGLSAYGQYQQGKFAEEQAEYNAKVAEQNAEVARQEGADRAADIRARGRAIRSRQRAVGAGTGLEVGSGSALDILMDTAQGSELDAQTAMWNAENEAYGLRMNASQLRTQGKMDRYSSRLSAAGTLLGSGASAYGMYAGR